MWCFHRLLSDQWQAGHLKATSRSGELSTRKSIRYENSWLLIVWRIYRVIICLSTLLRVLFHPYLQCGYFFPFQLLCTALRNVSEQDVLGKHQGCVCFVCTFMSVYLTHACVRRRALPFKTQLVQHSDRVSPVMSTSRERWEGRGVAERINVSHVSHDTRTDFLVTRE